MKNTGYIYQLFRKLSSIVVLPKVFRIVFHLIKYKCTSKKKISIIILFEHIGDIIACEPVSNYLKHEMDTNVVWIVKDSYAEVLTMFKDVDKIIKVKTLSEVIYLKYLLFVFDTYNLHFDKSRRCSKYGIYLTNSCKKLNFDNYYNFGSIIEAFSNVGGLPVLRMSPNLAIEDIDRFPELNFSYVAIQVESNDERRMWDLKKWEELISSNPSINFLEIGLKPYFSHLTNCITSYCGKLSLSDIAYVVKKSSLFIGIDSSCAHYANALQVPALILLGKFHKFDRYNPYVIGYPLFRILYNYNLKELPVCMVNDSMLELINQGN